MLWTHIIRKILNIRPVIMALAGKGEIKKTRGESSMKKTVCFTGHRVLSENPKQLFSRLYTVLEKLVTEQGITDFYAVSSGYTLNTPLTENYRYPNPISVLHARYRPSNTDLGAPRHPWAIEIKNNIRSSYRIIIPYCGQKVNQQKKKRDVASSNSPCLTL